MKVILNSDQSCLAWVEVIQQNLGFFHSWRQVALLGVRAYTFLELFKVQYGHWTYLFGPFQLVYARGQNSLNFGGFSQHVGSW